MATYAIRNVMWKTDRSIPKSVRREMLGYNDKDKLADFAKAVEEKKARRKSRRDSKSNRRSKSTNQPAVQVSPEDVALVS